MLNKTPPPSNKRGEFLRTRTQEPQRDNERRRDRASGQHERGFRGKFVLELPRLFMPRRSHEGCILTFISDPQTHPAQAPTEEEPMSRDTLVKRPGSDGGDIVSALEVGAPLSWSK